MFADHQPIIARYARAAPENLARVALFVILSVQQSLAYAPEAMRRTENDDNAMLYGWKHDAWRLWKRDAAAIFQDCEAIYNGFASPDTAAVELVAYLAQTRHGFGYAKAGFVIQLVYGISGCLDTVNLDRFGFGREAFKSRKYLRRSTFYHHSERYHTAVRWCGGTAELWDSWCAFVAKRDGKRPEEISALHLEALGL